MSNESDDKQPTQADLDQAIRELAAKGLIYDTGRRRDGEIVWSDWPKSSQRGES